MLKFQKLIVLSVLLSSGIIFQLSAQEKAEKICVCGAAGDNTPVGVMNAHPHGKGGWMFSYSFMQMNMKGLQEGSATIDRNKVFQTYLMSPKTMQMDMHMLMGMYGITDRLSIMSMVNYTTSFMNMEMLNKEQHNHNGISPLSSSSSMKYNFAGFNNISLFAGYTVISGESHKLILSAGVSVPVGGINQPNKNSMAAGQRFPYNMRLNSGTPDFLPVISYTCRKEKISFGAQASSMIHPFYNSLGYAQGNSYRLTSWAGWQWSSFLSTSIRMEGVAESSMQGKDNGLYAVMEPGADARNYGSQSLSFWPGFNYYVKQGCFEGLRIGAEIGLPMYQNFNGIQMPLKSQWIAGVQYSF